jgi:hypothetical protein
LAPAALVMALVAAIPMGVNSISLLESVFIESSLSSELEFAFALVARLSL